MYSELHVLHVMVMLFQLVLNVEQLFIDFRHGFFHGRIIGLAYFFANILLLGPFYTSFLGDLLWRSDARNDVLTLRIDQIFSIETVLTSCCIAGEAYACGRGITHVAKHHGHDRNGCTPFGGYAFHLAVQDSSLVHPAVKHRTNGTPKLVHGISREVFSCLFLDGILKSNNQCLEVINGHFIVKLHSTFGLDIHDDCFKWIDIFFVRWFHSENYIAVHLYKTAIAVISKTFVPGFLHQAFHNIVIQSQIQDGIHHAWH